MYSKENAEYIGNILKNKGLITQEQLSIVIEEAAFRNKSLPSLVSELDFAEEEKVLQTIASHLDIKYVRLAHSSIDAATLEKLPSRFVYHYHLIPFDYDGRRLSVAMADPLDVHALDDIRSLLGVEVVPFLASEKEIEEAIRKYYGVGADTLDKILSSHPREKKEDERAAVEDVTSQEEEISIITFVNQIMREAVKERATDIHLEPFEDVLHARFRVDGVLYTISLPESIEQFYPSIVSRIKIMANLNIAEKRLPQDGRIKVKVGNNELDLRVSIIPTGMGEAVHIRILSPYFFLDLDRLGLLDDDRALLEQRIKKPHGIILVTGPTGSGKSTTLYACLSRINSHEVKIVTIEDPVEYQLKGVIQIQVSNRIGLSFAQGLRAMLRHDPDVMMIGEIRDFETAEIAMRAALTGHLVFSTLHTNDSAGTITRMLDMGVEAFLLASSLECVIAQRLVRLICPACKCEVAASHDTLKMFEEFNLKTPLEFFEGKGCAQCRNTGYKGRTAIYEILTITEPVRECILAKASAQHIRNLAVSKGMRTLCHDGFRKIGMGLTTVPEVLRVAQQDKGG